MKREMTTTTFSRERFRVTKSLGVVRGITGRSRSIFGTEAFEMMPRHAQEIGANAVIGVAYDATEVMGGVTEVLCYGTAVVVQSA